MGFNDFLKTHFRIIFLNLFSHRLAYLVFILKK